MLIFVYSPMKLRWIYDEGKLTLYAKIMHGSKLKDV